MANVRKTVPGPRVLSLQQPWAWAVEAGHKKVENRLWSTNYRGTVFIHASTKLDRDAVTWLCRYFRLRVPDALPRGAVVAVAEIADVVTRKDATRFANWFFGPYGFVLVNVRALKKPVRTRGKLRLFRLSPALKRSVERQATLRPYAAGQRVDGGGRKTSRRPEAGQC